MTDLGRILGPDRPMQADRLLGPSPDRGIKASDGSTVSSTFERVKIHSVPGCCGRHDAVRRDAARKYDRDLAHGEPNLRKSVW